MGDVSAEPSMEDILSSIKRIIAEEGEAPGARARRPFGRGTPARLPDLEDADEILELDQPMDDFSEPEPVVSPSPRMTKTQEDPAERPIAAAAPPPADAAPILSPRAAEASRGALDNLSRLLIKPESPETGTLEGLVREMLRPMLKEWLDANLPDVVERLVAQEIARISGQAR